MNKVKSYNDSLKCLKCGTYYNQAIKNCPVCGRFLYTCSSIYQPKIKNK